MSEDTCLACHHPDHGEFECGALMGDERCDCTGYATGGYIDRDELLPPAGDEPDVWHNGGWVCRACGQPTETVPCEQHQPTAWAEENER